jgi:hypothetical protein
MHNGTWHKRRIMSSIIKYTIIGSGKGSPAPPRYLQGGASSSARSDSYHQMLRLMRVQSVCRKL